MTITNWNYPVVTDLYADVLTDLKFRDTAALSWLDTSVSDFTSLVNIPTKAKRWSDSNKYWEIYDGSAWVEMLTGAAKYNINVAKLDGKVLSDFVLTDTRAVANGVATLNADVVIPAAQIGDIDYGSNTTNPKTLRHRRMTTTQLATYAGTDGELVKNTTTNRLTMMDGTTLGGTPIVSGTGDGSFTTITVSGLTQLGTIQSGTDGVNLLVNSSGLAIGNTTPDNTEGWNRNLWVQGSVDARISLATSTGGISAGYWVKSAGYSGASAGGIIGTVSNHPFTILTNGVPRLVVGNSGSVNIHSGTTAELAVNAAGTKKLSYSDGDNTLLKTNGVRLYDGDNTAYYAITEDLYNYPASFPEFCRFSREYYITAPSFGVVGNIRGNLSYNELLSGTGEFTPAGDFSTTGWILWTAQCNSNFTSLSQVLNSLKVNVLVWNTGVVTHTLDLLVEIDYDNSSVLEGSNVVVPDGVNAKLLTITFRMYKEIYLHDWVTSQATSAREYLLDLTEPFGSSGLTFDHLTYQPVCQICPTTAVLKKV